MIYYVGMYEFTIIMHFIIGEIKHTHIIHFRQIVVNTEMAYEKFQLG